MNVRRAAFASILLLAAWNTTTAVPEFTKVREANEDQKKVMAGLICQIAAVQKDLEAYYDDLKERGCEDIEGGEKIFCDFNRINDKGLSLVPLSAEKQSFYGERERYIFNEQASVRWEEKKPSYFRFDTRKGMIGQGAVLIKQISGNSIATKTCEPGKYASQEDVASTPLNFVVNEILSSGRGLYVNFRFPSGDKEVRDGVEKIEIDGKQVEVQVVFIRDPAEKIRVMKEYLRLLKLLERRLDWNIRSEDARKAANIERLLRR